MSALRHRRHRLRPNAIMGSWLRGSWKPEYRSTCSIGWSISDRKSLEAGFEVRLVEAELLGLFERVGAQAHRTIFAEDLPVRSLVHIFELEEFLGDDHVAFHPDHFGNVGRSARAVAKALHL